MAHMSADGAEQRFVKEAFDSNWVVPLGPNVNGFEADLEAFVNSGSAEGRSATPNVGGGAVCGYGGGALGAAGLRRGTGR